MTHERIHDTLDGRLSRESLAGAERTELAAYDAAIAESLHLLPADGELPDLSAGVWRRIEQQQAAGGARAAWLTAPWRAIAETASWLWSPRPVRVRPALALAALLLLLGSPLAVQQTVERRAAAAGPMRMLVQFRVNAEGARNVALVGDFSGWDRKVPLEQVATGVWTVTVPLEPGVYDYAFVVDGQKWVLDPLAPTVADGFGGSNSRVAVLPPERGSRL